MVPGPRGRTQVEIFDNRLPDTDADGFADCPPGSVDVAAAGGWSDLTSLKTAYQQPDTATLYRVVSEPTELREVR